MNPKLVGIGALLLIVGVVLVGLTVYQELVEEPKPEDYHMGIPMAKYRWQTRNSAITVLGFGLLAFGLGFVLVGWKSK